MINGLLAQAFPLCERSAIAGMNGMKWQEIKDGHIVNFIERHNDH